MRITFPFEMPLIPSSVSWRAWPANLLTFCNLGAGAMVAWWAASEFDLGWAASEWAATMGFDTWLMASFGIVERRVMGILVMLGVWMFGLFCDVLDGAVARALGADGNQGAWLDSMADLVSGGLAPAFVGVALMKEWGAAGLGLGSVMWVDLLPMLLLPAAAWRLARYAGEAGQASHDASEVGLDFEGIPAPFSAVWWGLLLAVWAFVGGAESASWLWWGGLLGGTVLPFWMASRFPQFGLKQWGQFRWMDMARMGWFLGVLILLAFGGAGGLVLALISYPMMGAILHRALLKK
jgi:phosphatidylserine synthase